jgi:hypothetical protein
MIVVARARAVTFGEFGGLVYTDHVRFDPCHPYISTNGLMFGCNKALCAVLW